MARVRLLELRAKRLMREPLVGLSHSVLKGHGLDFDDFREYQHGDEIRFIDWNVTARTGTPHIRKFHEEKDMQVILAVDISASSHYGSQLLSKREFAAECAAAIGYSALHQGHACGLLLFGDRSYTWLPPAKGHRHLLRMIRDILVVNPTTAGTAFDGVLRHLMQAVKRRCQLFMISDFLADDLEQPLGILAQKHEVLALQVLDPAEIELPNAGRITLIDAETGLESIVNTANHNVRAGYATLMKRQREVLHALFQKWNMDYTMLNTSEDPLPRLHHLLNGRKLKRQRS